MRSAKDVGHNQSSMVDNVIESGGAAHRGTDARLRRLEDVGLGAFFDHADGRCHRVAGIFDWGR